METHLSVGDDGGTMVPTLCWESELRGEKGSEGPKERTFDNLRRASAIVSFSKWRK